MLGRARFTHDEPTVGLTVALVAAIKAAIKHGIGLTLWHYDRDSEGYLPQIVTEYKEPEDLIDTILRLYDALVTVESGDQRRAIKTAIERLKKDDRTCRQSGCLSRFA